MPGGGVGSWNRIGLFCCPRRYRETPSESLRSPAIELLKNKGYSVNLMWINVDFDPNRNYICDDAVLPDIAMALSGWRTSNPTAKLNLWYDARRLKKDSVARTKTALRKLGCTNYEMKDISSMDVVNFNPAVFSAQTPIYFRVDLLKLIICVHEIQESSVNCAIFSDIDMHHTAQSLTIEKLFDARTVEKIKYFGMLTNGGGSENQFIQVHNNPAIIKAIRHHVNVNLMRGACALYSARDNFIQTIASQRYIMKWLYRAVFFDTINNIHLYFFASQLGFIQVNLGLFDSDRNGEWVRYDVKEHGYSPFGQYSGHEKQLMSKVSGERLLARSKMLRFTTRSGEVVYDLQELLPESRRGDHGRVDIVASGCAHDITEFKSTRNPPNRVRYWGIIDGSHKGSVDGSNNPGLRVR